MNVLIFPHPALVTRAEEVTPQEIRTAEFQRNCADMCDIVRDTRAVGLAATQVGWGKRVFVMNTPSGIREFINPEVKYADTEQLDDEGCLSFPHVTEQLCGPMRVGVRYLDIASWSRPGNKDPYKEEIFYGVHARCVAHEVDHLNGRTMLDRMGKLQRKLFLKRYKKLSEQL